MSKQSQNVSLADQPTSGLSWPELERPLRIGLLADFHGSSKRQALTLFCAAIRPDLLLVAGDVQDYEPWPVPMIFVRGNHEDYRVIDALARGELAPRNVHYLPDLTVAEIAGLRVAGIGGISNTKDGPRKINEAAYEWLGQQGSLDIVISHATPINFSNGRPHLTDGGLRLLAEIVAPRLWISGHHHYFDAERLGPTQILSLGKWPHQWAVLDVATDGTFFWDRFIPTSESNYAVRLERWKEAAKYQKERLKSAGAQ